MKIGLVCPYSLAHAGGVQQIVRASQEELEKRGHEVTIITPLPRGHEDSVPHGAVFIGQSKRMQAAFGSTYDVAVSINTGVIKEVLAEHQFDIIHMHEPLVPFLSMQMLPRITCPVVGTFHAAMPESFMVKMIAGSMRPYVRSILRQLDGLTAVSPAATTYIDEYEHGEVSFIPNGIDLNWYKPADSTGRSADKKTILYVGRLEGRKGVNYLLQAFGQIAAIRPDLHLVIAGDGPDRQKLTAMAAKLHLVRTTFLGKVSETEKLRLLQQATVFCSPPTYGESFGIVLLEAMACGIPVVAGNNMGYQSVLTDRGQISLVDSEDIDALARKLELMTYDEGVRKLWREWALTAVTEYGFPRVIDQYEAYYLRMAAKVKVA